MKHFNAEQKRTALLALYGAFDAISNKEYMKHAKKGVRYGLAGFGINAPINVCNDLRQALENLEAERLAYELANNSPSAIIRGYFREFEAHVLGDLGQTVNAVEAYGIDRDMVESEFRSYCRTA